LGKPWRTNNKDRQTSNTCIYKAIKHKINQPHEEDPNGFQAQLRKRSG
jgi:hypothetical protein